MYAFSDLVRHSTVYSLNALEVARNNVIEEFHTCSATSLVKAAQMIRLQKAITAVGMFSMFDAILQDQLKCSDGFKGAAKMLEDKGDSHLNENFHDLQKAINVLKHGKGSSYDALVRKSGTLPFKVKQPDETFFNEGYVDEIATLVEVDDAFVLLCAKVIDDVAKSILSA